MEKDIFKRKGHTVLKNRQRLAQLDYCCLQESRRLFILGETELMDGMEVGIKDPRRFDNREPLAPSTGWGHCCTTDKAEI